MTTAERLRALALSIQHASHDVLAFADVLARGELPDREMWRRFAGAVAAMAHDVGEAQGLRGQMSETSVEDGSAALIAEVERAPDPPGRVTPNARPTRTKLPGA